MADYTGNTVDQMPTLQRPARVFDPGNRSPTLGGGVVVLIAAENSGNNQGNNRFLGLTMERQPGFPWVFSTARAKGWETVVDIFFSFIMLVGSYSFCLYIPQTLASCALNGFAGIFSSPFVGFAATGTVITQQQVDDFLKSLIFGYKVVLVFCGAVAFPAGLGTIQILDVKNEHAIATGIHVAGLLVILCAISSALLVASFRVADTVTGAWNSVALSWMALLKTENRAAGKHIQRDAWTFIAIPGVFLACAVIVYGVTLTFYFCTSSAFWGTGSDDNSKGFNDVEIIVSILGTMILIGMFFRLKRLGKTILHT